MNIRWMSSLNAFLCGTEWIVFHGHLDYFQKPPFGGRHDTKLEDHGTMNVSQPLVYLILSCVS